MTTQVIGGAAQGAQAGYKVSGGNPWGAAIGAVVGGIGGMFGDKAAKYRRKATKEEERAVEIQQSAQRRSIVREIYLARSQALAASAAEEGGLQSSAPLGAISSIGTTGTKNLKMFDALIARQIMQKYYTKKAGKNQGYSDSIMGIIQGINGGGGGMGGGMGMMGGGGGSKGGNSGGYGSPTGMDYGSMGGYNA